MPAENIFPLFDDDFEAPPTPPPGRLDRFLRGVQCAWHEERSQRLLWVPIFWAMGAAVYFAFPIELPIAAALFLLGLLACAALFSPKIRSGLALLALIVAGFAGAQLKTSLLDGPLIAKKQPPRVYIATVLQIDKRVEGGWRLHLQGPGVAGEQLSLPDKIRVVVRTDIPERLKAGMRVSLNAVLTPLPRPVLPGGYDFGRQLFLKGYGATGFAVSGLTILGDARTYEPPLFANAQAGVGEAIDAALVGPSAGLAKALLLGDKTGIPQDIKDSYRQAGLAHLLAISGLHMALVASFVFLVVRQGFAAVPALALSFPLKSLAAGATILVLLGYLGLVGAPISAQRATVMAACVMLAIIVGRSAISLRTAALAGIGLLLFWPENVTDIGFQMSFAAVIALISGYEATAKPIALLKATLGPVQGRILTYSAGIFLSTVLAEIAVFPLSLYHFNEITLYGLAGNAFAVPMTAFWIMPAGLIGIVLTPLGVSEPAFVVMGYGLDIVTAMTQNIAAAPGAFLAAKSPSTFAVTLFFAGGIGLCLMKTRLRFAGLALMVLAIPLGAMGRESPTLLVSETGSSYAVQTHENGYVLLRGRRNSFAAEVWARQMGQVGFKNTAAQYQLCDLNGCSTGLWPDEAGNLKAVPIDEWPSKVPPYRLEYLRKPSGLADSCHKNAVLITTFDLQERCKAAVIRLDRPALAAGGPFTVKAVGRISAYGGGGWPEKDGYGTQTVAANTAPFIATTADTLKVTVSPAFVPSRPWHPVANPDPRKNLK